MLTPQVGWVCRHEGRAAAVVHVGDEVMIDGEFARGLVLLTVPVTPRGAPTITLASTADVDVTPSARPAKVLVPVARWLGTHRLRTPDVVAVEDAALTLLGWTGAAA